MIRRPPLTQEISKSRSAWAGANHMPPIEKWGFLIIPATRLSTKPYTLKTQMCVRENNFRGILALPHPFSPMIRRTVIAAYLKAAKQIGFTIPPNVLVRADKVKKQNGVPDERPVTMEKLLASSLALDGRSWRRS